MVFSLLQSHRKSLSVRSFTSVLFHILFSSIEICLMYEGRSINKLQNGAVSLILKIGKVRNIRFVENLILNIHRNFFDDGVIIMTSSVVRTQSICVLFSPPVFIITHK